MIKKKVEGLDNVLLVSVESLRCYVIGSLKC